jgi:hypothetical protein
MFSIVLSIYDYLTSFNQMSNTAAEPSKQTSRPQNVWRSPYSMISTGEANGVNPCTAFLTRMNEPIGCMVGNWLEVKECIDILNGEFILPYWPDHFQSRKRRRKVGSCFARGQYLSCR